ncbi:MAG: PQQ-dependent sugar dehydrogenase [Hyphomonadaceae bacterium]
MEHGRAAATNSTFPEAGKNYGWPVITYGIDYPGGPIGEGITAHEGMEQPVYYWDPVIAPGDMTFYQGDLFPWKGDLLIAGLSGPIVRLEIEDDRVIAEERLDPDLGRMRDIVEAPDGSLYVITDDSDGVLARLTPST